MPKLFSIISLYMVAQITKIIYTPFPCAPVPGAEHSRAIVPLKTDTVPTSTLHSMQTSTHCVYSTQTTTRKPCYRKGDRAMRRTCAWPGDFRKSLATPMATIAEIVNGLLLRWIVRKRIQNQKFVAITVNEITAGTFRFWAAHGYDNATF